jgi:hypothetical protein
MLSVFSKIAIIILFLSLNLYSQQELYIPKEIKAAYQKGTRSFDGKPGPEYWRNYSSYNIDVSIDPASKRLSGSLRVVYENNSPDTLKKLVFKLYQNLNKCTTERNFILPEEAVTEGMNISRLLIDRSEYDISSSDQVSITGTNMVINLTSPLLPGERQKQILTGTFIIPLSSPRMGVKDSVSFFLGYWYPKIAVYDDINRWDMYPYEGEHEFYSGYSSFKVNITMPRGYMVWATGMPENIEEILSDEIYSKYQKALAADTVVNVISKVDLKKSSLFKGNKKEYTWKFSADEVPDFAFGTSAHYVWQMMNVNVKDKNTIVQTAFNPSAESYYEVIKFAAGAIEQFPSAPQAHPYPYPQITVFHGNSGMEFPMIVNDDAFPNRSTDVYVTTHEITHQFFPFYVAMSETRYGWFDEGMAYFLPQKIQLSFDPSDHRARAARGYANYAGKETDVPLMTPTYFIREPDLGIHSYFKSAIAFDMLKECSWVMICSVNVCMNLSYCGTANILLLTISSLLLTECRVKT